MNEKASVGRRRKKPRDRSLFFTPPAKGTRSTRAVLENLSNDPKRLDLASPPTTGKTWPTKVIPCVRNDGAGTPRVTMVVPSCPKGEAILDELDQLCEEAFDELVHSAGGDVSTDALDVIKKMQDDILGIVGPALRCIDGRMDDTNDIIEALLQENESLRTRVKALHARNYKLTNNRRTRLSADDCSDIWTCCRILTSCSHRDMRILRRCEATCRGKEKCYAVPSERAMQASHRRMCKAVSACVKHASVEFGEGHEGTFVDVKRLLEHDLNFHAKVLKGEHLAATKTDSCVRIGMRWGADGAPVTRNESWTIASIGSTICKRPRMQVFHRLTMVSPHGEGHPTTKLIVENLSEQFKELREPEEGEELVIKWTQRRKTKLEIRYVAAIVDWYTHITFFLVYMHTCVCVCVHVSVCMHACMHACV